MMNSQGQLLAYYQCLLFYSGLKFQATTLKVDLGYIQPVSASRIPARGTYYPSLLAFTRYNTNARLVESGKFYDRERRTIINQFQFS